MHCFMTVSTCMPLGAQTFLAIKCIVLYCIVYAIAFTCPKIHPGANYTYMYNIHPVGKSAHVNGALKEGNHFQTYCTRGI